MNQWLRHVRFVTGGCLFAALLTQCQSTTAPGLLVYDRGGTPGVIQAVIGTYGPGCNERSGSWSVVQEPGCDSVTEPSLSVASGNDACELTVTSVIIDCKRYTTRGVPMGGTSQPYGSPFALEGSCTPTFYGNVSIGDPTFATPSIIKIIVASDVTKTSADAVAQFEKVQPLVSSAQVPAPDYTADTSSVVIKVDANNIVTTATGIIDLVPGMHAGESYIVIPELLPAQRTYAVVDVLFQMSAATPIATPLSISALNLLNQPLLPGPPKQYHIIVAHSEAGVFSYELITISVYPAVL